MTSSTTVISTAAAIRAGASASGPGNNGAIRAGATGIVETRAGGAAGVIAVARQDVVDLGQFVIMAVGALIALVATLAWR
ncbi:MAG: hypothetical protein IPQ07_14925 [Myxococcales bacterium]|nr:hypothetical protein [Myxococcales bacterium]